MTRLGIEKYLVRTVVGETDRSTLLQPASALLNARASQRTGKSWSAFHMIQDCERLLADPIYVCNADKFFDVFGLPHQTRVDFAKLIRPHVGSVYRVERSWSKPWAGTEYPRELV